MNINILVSLSENDKRVLIALLLVFILILLLFGYLVKLIKFICNVQGEFVDKSMYDILDANLITTRKEFNRISLEKNRRKFYFEARIPMLILISMFFIVLIYQIVISNFSWEFMVFYLKEACIKLSWPTQKLFGIPFISDWPTVIKPAVFYLNKFDAWLTYIFTLVASYGVIHFLVCVCALLSRNYRTFTAGRDYFKKNINDLKKAKINSGNNVHLEKPTKEMQELVEKDGTKSL
ncbi:MAG: hypothetical protein PUA56_01160 [Bacillales bacterium]|nr:hypothetical protein [Bacillales bacterium]